MPAVAADGATDRATYAADLRRQLLSDGWSVQVTSEEKIDPRSPPMGFKGLFPKLTLYGPIGDVFVFQAGGEAKIVDRAAKMGFKSVDFFSNVGQGHYIFVISGQNIPHCDTSNRICF